MPAALPGTAARRWCHQNPTTTEASQHCPGSPIMLLSKGLTSLNSRRVPLADELCLLSTSRSTPDRFFWGGWGGPNEKNRQMQTRGNALHSKAQVHLHSLCQTWLSLKTHTVSETENRTSCLTAVSQTITVGSCQSDISNRCRIKKPCITGICFSWGGWGGGGAPIHDPHFFP